MINSGTFPYALPAQTQAAHPKEPQLCYKFMQDGGCQAGDKCKFLHCPLKNIQFALKHLKGAPTLTWNGPKTEITPNGQQANVETQGAGPNKRSDKDKRFRKKDQDDKTGGVGGDVKNGAPAADTGDGGVQGQQGSAAAGENSQPVAKKMEDMTLAEQVEHLKRQIARPKWCTYYLKGTCSKGEGCDFAHIEQDAVDKIIEKRDQAQKQRITVPRRRRDDKVTG